MARTWTRRVAEREIERAADAASDGESCELIEGPWPDKADAWRAQVPDGRYHVAYVSSKLTKRYSRNGKPRPDWDVLFQVVEGPAGGLKGEDGELLPADTFVGQRLFYYVTQPEPCDRPSLRSKLACDYRLIAERLPPKHLHRIRPSELYGECVLEAFVQGRKRTSRGDASTRGRSRFERDAHSRPSRRVSADTSAPKRPPKMSASGDFLGLSQSRGRTLHSWLFTLHSSLTTLPSGLFPHHSGYAGKRRGRAAVYRLEGLGLRRVEVHATGLAPGFGGRPSLRAQPAPDAARARTTTPHSVTRSKPSGVRECPAWRTPSEHEGGYRGSSV